MKKSILLSLGLIACLALLAGGSFAVSTKEKQPLKIAVDRDIQHLAFVLIVDDGSPELGLSAPNWNEFAVVPYVYLMWEEKIQTDTYLMRSQEWIRKNNLHKTGLYTTFDTSKSRVVKLC